MADNNHFVLKGIVEEKPILSEYNGAKKAELKIRQQYSYQGNVKVSIYTITAWRELADGTIALEKGDSVEVQGKISSKGYEKEGVTRHFLSLQAQQVIPSKPVVAADHPDSIPF